MKHDMSLSTFKVVTDEARFRMNDLFQFSLRMNDLFDFKVDTKSLFRMNDLLQLPFRMNDLFCFEFLFRMNDLSDERSVTPFSYIISWNTSRGSGRTTAGSVAEGEIY